MNQGEGEVESAGGRVEQKLHEAIVEGNTKLEAFKEILNKDPKILDRIKVGCFIHTPLHVAAYHGHLEFVKEILKKSPGLVEVLDSQRWSPLHLASARGHLDIVQALVLENPDMCTALDGDARTPLHLAAMKGNLDVMDKLMNVKDVAGNTILHLAVRNKKWQVVKYLLEKIEKAEKTENRINVVNAINNCGYTAYDIIMESKNDTQEFKDIIVTFRKVKAVKANLSKGEWLSKKRDILMVVASLIATMAFQAAISPPGEIRLRVAAAAADGTNPPKKSSHLLQSTPPDNLQTSVNEVGYVTENIEAMKISKCPGSSIANLPTGLDMVNEVGYVTENIEAMKISKCPGSSIANLPTGLDMDQSNGVSSLENIKCKLLHWEGTSLVVTEGQIASRDPKSNVQHVTFGPICWKVWVNRITANVPLFSSTRDIGDAFQRLYGIDLDFEKHFECGDGRGGLATVSNPMRS
ncbi:hypothetical protein TEA_029719 [Camellia sinensis var. sinensis]|uniref:PGG domain-containing protein n=1 Tax=Camellia sinensis var. sinensis TaxID=542762 RepID=A0A4S4EJD6_CAMSN|nr:hypothetical protein TEA_029719 [Camellia sinensis var. sinensis]